jgi:hypothetical protein
MGDFWTQTTEIDIEVEVAPEITQDVTVIDQDVAVIVDDEITLAVAVVDFDVAVENAEAEEYLDVQVNTGEKGDKGDKGEPGDDGPPGDGLQIDASGNLAGRDAYDSEAEGFTYLDTTAGLLYVRETAVPGVWSTGVDFGGADGTDGNTILNGIIDPVGGDGVDGDFFINTVTNYIFGPKNTSWPAGVSIKGADGVIGADGKTVLNGTSDPDDGSDGVDGDFYIKTTTYFMFGPKAAGVWPAGYDLKGTDGSPGDPGADGKTILYGIVNPTSEGTDGDFYINTVTNYIFGPKSGTWPTGTSLVGSSGPAGDDGRTVLYGPADPDTEGLVDDFYINTTTNFIFGPKAISWPAGTSLVGPKGDTGEGFSIDAQGTTAGRDAYDSEAEGFSYLDTDTSLLYFRETVTPGVWSTGIVFGKGDKGDKGDTGDTGTGIQGEQGDPGIDGDDYTGPAIYAQVSNPNGPDGSIWIMT